MRMSCEKTWRLMEESGLEGPMAPTAQMSLKDNEH